MQQFPQQILSSLGTQIIGMQQEEIRMLIFFYPSAYAAQPAARLIHFCIEVCKGVRTVLYGGHHISGKPHASLIERQLIEVQFFQEAQLFIGLYQQRSIVPKPIERVHLPVSVAKAVYPIFQRITAYALCHARKPGRIVLGKCLGKAAAITGRRIETKQLVIGPAGLEGYQRNYRVKHGPGYKTAVSEPGKIVHQKFALPIVVQHKSTLHFGRIEQLAEPLIFIYIIGATAHKRKPQKGQCAYKSNHHAFLVGCTQTAQRNEGDNAIFIMGRNH